MCLLLFAYNAHPKYKLILAANRDEFYDRPAAPARFWEDAPGILAGRDLRLGGTWLGVTREGRLAAVTNYRDPGTFRNAAKSRGILVAEFLKGKASADAYLQRVEKDRDAYNPFNLIAGDADALFWLSNRAEGVRRISPGIHGLSNRLLDTPWPKVRRGIRLFADALETGETQLEKRLFSLLTDTVTPSDAELPDTGVGLDWERILSSIFIQSPAYGTRSSTVVLMGYGGRIVFAEQTFHASGAFIRKGPFRRFAFGISDRTGS
ncbi:MAG: NRDE family protein [Deltaproteobacteria bacterium]|nr:NRDE family protein [Deltaproteobacteria bacterium]MBW1955440.1 NRDE family protein [Deltaproteobacteria bacterium]MBW2040609.1 NRDE family protein [Deltaproteobacteria bacterium]MBW2132298.1 NRDE family protein [Deltaproteobacteria bacterium]